jgi:hypothetical protein
VKARRIFTIVVIILFNFFSYSLMAQAEKSSSPAPEVPRSPGKRTEPPVDANNLRIHFMSVTAEPCKPGFAGYDINVTGRKITTQTYFDNSITRGKPASLTDLQVISLTAIVKEWNTTVLDTTWRPAGNYCAYNVSGYQMPYFEWNDSDAKVPLCVLKLVVELRRIVNGLEESGKTPK